MINDETQNIIDGFNDISKNAGIVSFKIKYAAIPSNREIHKDFTEFAFNEANNNYLNAINLLLKYKKIFDWFEVFEQRISQIEYNMEGLRDHVINNGEEENNKKENKDSGKPKTF